MQCTRHDPMNCVMHVCFIRLVLQCLELCVLAARRWTSTLVVLLFSGLQGVDVMVVLGLGLRCQMGSRQSGTWQNL